MSLLSQSSGVRLLDTLFDLLQRFDGYLFWRSLRFGDIASDFVHAIGDVQMLGSRLVRSHYPEAFFADRVFVLR